LNPVLSGYFSKLLEVFLNRKAKQIINYVYSRDSILDRMAHHISSKSLAEVLIKFLDVEEDALEESQDLRTHQTRVLGIIVGKLRSDKEEDSLNAA
jgi:hypothetical protein